ncbi:HpcH/HpaI aldolase family protein [Actinophytocola xanthii]|uniref:Aldolase n=1 Tax=Actinophytocola xanthii TaxID=1912961 RepID=A0A1Q8CLX9_9PSEU|nr:aldolase/citrate lyase family protein [Actinophytocola xanthii]OLF15368.1 aldolase [Actinophytocola xanthii]
MTAAEFAARLRAREPVIGYWSVLDAPPAAERLGRLGYDYVCLDGQHGMIGYSGLLASLIALDAAGGDTVGLVRVEANDITPIGRALDAGAVGVIVPLVDTAADAADAVASVRYPPLGRRSFAPGRAGQKVGTTPGEANAVTVVIAMIETAGALSQLDAICATPGLDGVYVGPSDLSLAVGGAFPMDPAVADEFEEAVTRVRESARRAGIAAGIHTPNGETAARRLAEGFTFASISSDLSHLEAAARAHLEAARS